MKMKTGYHITTWEHYQTIREKGLAPSPYQHSGENPHVDRRVKRGCIWLHLHDMPVDKLFGSLMYFAIRHGSMHLVRLLVEYEDSQAVSDEEIRDLKHTSDGLGRFNHARLPIELLVSPVPPERIHLIGEWDFADFVQEGRYIRPEARRHCLPH